MTPCSATRLDANVEQMYRKAIQTSTLSKIVTLPAETENSTYYTYYNFTENDEPSDSIMSPEMQQMLTEFQHSPIHFEPKDSSKPVILDRLPNEILLQCLRWLCLLDVSYVHTLSLTCKKFFLLLRDPSLWAFLSDRVHIPHGRRLADELPLYSNDWLRLYLEKPRLKYHGVYISRVNYVRQGYTETYNQPIHLVTYYRYIRFFPDGRVISITSTTEPAVMVKALNGSNVKGLMQGEYQYENGQVTLEMTDPDRPLTLFKCTLTGMMLPVFYLILISY